MIERVKELRFPKGKRKMSLQKTADTLNSEGFKTRREGMIRVIQVRNILKHLDS